MRAYVAVCFISAWLAPCLCGCDKAKSHGAEGDGMKTPAELLSVAEDEKLPTRTRANAVAELGHLKNRSLASRLGKLLPGDGDLLTYEIVIALGEIGGPDALASLQGMQYGPSYHNVNGKINAALQDSIARCKETQK